MAIGRLKEAPQESIPEAHEMACEEMKSIFGPPLRSYEY